MDLPRWVVTCALVVSMGCLREASEVCGDGSVCPSGLQCIDTGASTTAGRICATGTCGNGRLDPDEHCDDGNNRSGDGCPADCGTPCGDGVRDPDEVCDDGNTEDGDGCAPDCAALGSLFALSPSTVEFAVVEGDPLPAPVIVTVRLQRSDDAVTVGYEPGVPQPSWLSIEERAGGANTAAFGFRVTDTALVGEHSTRVRVLVTHEASTAIEAYNLSISYRVTPSDLAGAAQPAALTFTAIADVAGVPAQSVELTFTGATIALVAAPAWLTVSPTASAATSPVSFTVSVDGAAPTAGTTRSGELAFETARGSVRRTIRIPVTYRGLRLPVINQLDRLALVPGSAGPVMVYGSGLAALRGPSDVDVAGVSPTAVTVLSDRALTMTMPAMPAGEYAVTLRNEFGVEGPSQPLSVLAPVERSHEEIAIEGAKSALVWDAITQSAYVVNVSLSLVTRLDLSQQPVGITARPIAGAYTLGMPIGRSSLIVSDQSGKLHELDPVTLATRRVHSAGAALQRSSMRIPITGDNLAWIGSLDGLAFDLDRGMPATSADPGNAFACDYCAASPDGRRMVINQSGSYSPSPPLVWRDTAAGTLHPYETAPISIFYRSASDRTGDRWILDTGAVYDFDLVPQGTISVPPGWLGMRYAMSRNGRRAYVFAIADNAIGTYSEPIPVVFPKIFVFDTTGPLITTTTYPLLGSFDVAAYASCLATQGPVPCSPYSLSFAMTDDERTLLAIGDRRFLVIPIPPGLQSP